jgi:hypothetical protein
MAIPAVFKNSRLVIRFLTHGLKLYVHPSRISSHWEKEQHLGRRKLSEPAITLLARHLTCKAPCLQGTLLARHLPPNSCSIEFSNPLSGFEAEGREGGKKSRMNFQKSPPSPSRTLFPPQGSPSKYPPGIEKAI